MDSELTQTKLKTALKLLMKRQGHGYADLAKIWECSLPTVKRQLGSEEMPLSRLLSALEWLGVNLAELHALAESETLETPRFTVRQNEFLAKNPREFSFFMLLYQEMTPAQIAQKFKLPSAVVDKILIQLEKHDLIRVLSGGRVKPAYASPPNLDGALAEAHLRRIVDRMAEFHRRKIGDLLALQERGVERPKGGLSWFVAEVTEPTYLNFNKKMTAMVDEFVATARLEEKSARKKSTLKSAVVNLGCFLLESSDPHLYLARDVVEEGLRGPGARV